MKKIALVAAALMMVFSLAACATNGGGTMKVKCPACGYEYEVPLQ